MKFDFSSSLVCLLCENIVDSALSIAIGASTFSFAFALSKTITHVCERRGMRYNWVVFVSDTRFHAGISIHFASCSSFAFTLA